VGAIPDQVVQAWEKVPVYDQVKGVTTLSYENS